MEPKSFKDTLLRGIALLGLILILVLGAWGIIVLAFNAPSILSSAGQTIAGVFGAETDEEREEETEEENEEEVVEVPVVSPTKPTTPAKPTAPKPTYTYTPAPQPVAQLYGAADLATRIISVVPQGSRYAMQFEVRNIGTNVAHAGWIFNAELPLEPEYTYHSGPQQALRPGDKIVYTLGFEVPRYSRDHDEDERYEDCDARYDRWDEEEWQDWYEDVFDRDADSREDWDADEWEEWYDDYCDDYEDDRNDDYRSSGTVMVMVDPYGHVYDSNRSNNSASQRVNFNYYSGYPYYWSY